MTVSDVIPERDTATMSSPAGRVVIVGAGAAGVATAEALRENGFPGEILLIGEEPHLPYDRPPLSKQLLAGSEGFDFVQLATESTWTDSLTFLLGRRATALDVVDRRVRIDDHEWISYDTLVIATGVKPRRLPGTAGADGVLTLRTYDDAIRLRDRLKPGARVVVIGAGFIGLEVAATASKASCGVDVVEFATSALKGRFPEEFAARIVSQHRDRGTRFHFGRTVATWRTRAGIITAVDLDDGTTIDADVVVVGIGTVPATNWLDDSGLALSNGVVCDDDGRAADGVYAVGDVANWYDPRIARHNRVEHRLSAGEQARIVAAVIADRDHGELDLPFFWTDQYDDKWQVYGYSAPDAEVEIVLDDPAANRIVALLRRGDRIEAVLGRNAAKLLLPYRRQLRAAAGAIRVPTRLP